MSSILLLLLIGAEPTCEQTYVDAQRYQRDGKLLDARAALVRCAQRDCPKQAQSDCAEWMEQVEARLPTIVVRVQDAEGRDVIGAELFLDGSPIPDSADGRALEIDPGAHQLRVEAPSFLPREERITTLEGEKSRRIDLLLSPVAPPPHLSTPSATVPLWIYLTGSTGLVGMGSFAYFAITSTRDYENLRSTCAPSCSGSETDPIARKQLVADLSLGVGIAGLSSALIGLLIYAFTDRESAADVTTGVTSASSTLWN
jgi:hypothetical protein